MLIVDALAGSLLLGLLLGIRHALDADHVATLAAVVVGRTGLLGALRVAILWGLGHSVTFFAVGLGMVLFGIRVPQSFETAVELAIAASLIALGAAQLWQARRDRVVRSEPHAARPFFLGTLHGLAGSAGVALVALSTIDRRSVALIYLAFFALGTIAGMAAVTVVLASSFRLSASLGWARRALVVAAGVASCLCGIGMVFEVWG